MAISLIGRLYVLLNLRQEKGANTRSQHRTDEGETYYPRVSDLEKMVRRKEEVSLGLNVDGTITYSPGCSNKNSITSRAFM